MSESFDKQMHPGSGENVKTFHFRKIWYEGFINPKYTVSSEGMVTIHMVRNEEGNWILERETDTPAQAVHLEKQFARAITENE